MTKASDDHCRQSLRLLADGYAAIVAQYERTIALLEAELSRSSHPLDGNVHSTTPRVGSLMLDTATLSIEFRKRRCFLGNTVPLRVFRQLLERPNQFIGHQELLDQVWRGVRSSSTIRSAIKVLRRQLRNAGMREVADAIDGQAGHYALVTDRL